MSGTRFRRRNARGGTLLLIAAFMIISAVVRLGAQAGPALSQFTAQAGEAVPTGPDAQPREAPDTPEQMQRLVRALKEREEAVTRREQQLEDRMQALKVAESAVESRIAALEEAEQRLRSTLAVADGASERDLAQLTSVYEQMKPKDTAAVFQEMAPEFAAGFLARMRPEVAASVLAGMDPKAAYSVSVVLAGRNMQVPTR